MLRTPDGHLAVLHDLRLEHATESRRQRLGGLLAPEFVKEGITRLFVGDALEQFENVRHGVVVVSDVVVITALQRINLRPAAVRELRGENEVQSLDESFLAILPFRGLPNAGEQIHFRGGRAVVERGDGMRRFARLVLRSPLHAGFAQTFAEPHVQSSRFVACQTPASKSISEVVEPLSNGATECAGSPGSFCEVHCMPGLRKPLLNPMCNPPVSWPAKRRRANPFPRWSSRCRTGRRNAPVRPARSAKSIACRVCANLC